MTVWPGATLTLLKPLRYRIAVSAAPTNVARKSPPPTFEQALNELESIVAKMEQGDLSLEEALKTFERGIELTRLCDSTLRQAEQKVRVLTAESPSEAEPEPFQGAE